VRKAAITKELEQYGYVLSVTWIPRNNSCCHSAFEFEFYISVRWQFFPLKMLCSHLGLHAARVKFWSAHISRYLEGFCSDFLVSFTDCVLRTTSSALQWGGMVLIKWNPKADAINVISSHVDPCTDAWDSNCEAKYKWRRSSNSQTHNLLLCCASV
jgi:hypothetical protein